jgi:hypothetical protein
MRFTIIVQWTRSCAAACSFAGDLHWEVTAEVDVNADGTVREICVVDAMGEVFGQAMAFPGPRFMAHLTRAQLAELEQIIADKAVEQAREFVSRNVA